MLLKLRSESELSIILVEQNSRVAFEFSDRSVVLDKGRIGTMAHRRCATIRSGWRK